MKRLFILADDYTGALDTGVQFSGKGVRTLVFTSEQLSFSRARDMGVSVLIVDTESRHIPPRDARRIVRDMAARALDDGFDYFYKKTDSALRGNVGAELAGLLDAGIGSRLSFIPALPKGGRTTENGVHYIDGVEAALSAFASDPLNPVAYSHVAEIIAHTLGPDGITTENITRDRYPAASGKSGAAGAAVRIFDAVSMDDMAEIGRHLKRGGNLKLTAGCAGFAGVLADILELEPGAALPEITGGGHKEVRRVLLVSGSLNPAAIRQLSRGDALGFTTVPLTHRLGAAYTESRECDDFVRAAADEIVRNGRVILRADDAVAAAGRPAEMGDARVAARNIGVMTHRILNSAGVDCLVVFGGDTLHAILSETRCEGVVPACEVSPGAAAAYALTCPGGSVMLITKAGGLGGDDVLDDIDSFLRRQEGRQG